jgi:hypothetical protein
VTPIIVIDLSSKIVRHCDINCTDSPAAKPILTEVEAKLKERYPTCKFSWYVAPPDTGPTSGAPMEQVESKYKAKFEEWVKGVDAVVAAVGD